MVIARTNTGGGATAVSWLDPSNTSNPFWNFATGLTSPPQAVAVGTDVDGGFVVVAEPTRVFRLPKPTVVVTDASDVPIPAKFVVDFPAGSANCLVDNVITLKVKFSPTTLVPDTVPSKQRVTWTIEDPDDPSGDGTIDPNGTLAGDNIEVLGSYDQWESDGTYSIFAPGLPTAGDRRASSIDTEVIGGVSRIKLHPSCHPGDNYRIRAAVNVPVHGTLVGSTDLFTIWRKLHIELDSMGVAIGPFDCEPDGTATECDAVMGDIPDPILSYFAAAFKPAYVDVVPPDTGQDSPNVRFQYNVPFDNQAIFESHLGNAMQSAPSSDGKWVAYVQGAYEGDKRADFDPNGETDPTIGDSYAGTTIPGQATSLIFNEVIRDEAAAHPSDNEYDRSVVPLHEVGHEFGILENSNCGIIKPVPILVPLFCPEQIRKIRSNTRPSFP